MANTFGNLVAKFGKQIGQWKHKIVSILYLNLAILHSHSMINSSTEQTEGTPTSTNFSKSAVFCVTAVG